MTGIMHKGTMLTQSRAPGSFISWLDSNIYLSFRVLSRIFCLGGGGASRP